MFYLSNIIYANVDISLYLKYACHPSKYIAKMAMIKLILLNIINSEYSNEVIVFDRNINWKR